MHHNFQKKGTKGLKWAKNILQSKWKNNFHTSLRLMVHCSASHSLCCQALSISLSLPLYLSISQSINFSLSLRDRDRADTKITFHHPLTTENFLRTLEMTYPQVWYIIGIVSSSPSYFCTENIGLIGVTIYLPCQQ